MNKVLVVVCVFVTTFKGYAETIMTNQMLRLDFPSQTMMSFETCCFSLTVSNSLNHSLYVLPEIERSGLLSAQVVPEYWGTKVIPHYWYGTYRLTNVVWFAITNSNNLIQITPGSTHTWKLNDVDIDLEMCAKYAVTNISYKLQIDSGVWIRSNRCEINSVIGELNSTNSVFESAYQLTDNRMIDLTIHKTRVDSYYCLFTNYGQRICSLATNEVPSFAMNTNAAILTVTLPVSRKTVRYYPRTGRIEEEAMP